MSKRLEYFRFEVIPEGYNIYALGPDQLCGMPGLGGYRIEVGYGGKRYGIGNYMPSPEIGITESFLEHLIRYAAEEFKKAIRKETDDKAKAELDAAVTKAADAYAAKVRR
jgi:hypothetical protein